ncbi:MAG: ABC transporter permease [Coprobacillaceae bacterium]
MNGILLAIQSAIAQGIIWGIMALGVYITFRILDIADMTVDGSFATGGGVCLILITSGVSPMLAIIAAFISGCIAGIITGILHAKCKISAILAGILTQIALYSINLRIMGNRSNLPLGASDSTIFKLLKSTLDIPSVYINLIIGIGISLLVIIVLYWFFGTEIGSAIRATGNNEKMVTAQGISISTTKILGLMISNGLIALSGGLTAQLDGSADVKMGIGSIVIALASIVIGEVVFGRKGGFAVRLTSILIGSSIYRIIIAIVLQADVINDDDMKLFTAILVAAALIIPTMNNKRRQISMYKKLTGKEITDAND